jgi:hypothetical protein
MRFEPPRTHEIIYTKPSGFWTSNVPAEPGHEYRWRLLGIGLVIMMITGYFMWRAVKKAKEFRARR